MLRVFTTLSHGRRRSNIREFHEQLTTGGVMKLLAQGGIVLCGVERAGYGDMPERANVKEAET